MESTYLIINIGSSSKKYALYTREGDSMTLRYQAHFERVGENYFLHESKEASTEIPKGVFESALEHVLMMCEIYQQQSAIQSIGIRVVAPGTFFQKHTRIDDLYVRSLGIAERSAPLHIKPLRAEIRRIQQELPSIPCFALSDSAIHSTMPVHARHYAISKTYTQEKDMYRFGYHGLSVAYAIETIRNIQKTLPSRIIVCHLGSGASVTAIKDGISIDTSMGYSPLEGLLMSTRSGDIDASVVLRMAREYGVESTERMLYHESGLLGLSGMSDDMKILLENESQHDEARQAVMAFVYRIQKYIGAYYAILGGIDALVFTGTMGERSDPIRAKICTALTHADIFLDEQKNKQSLKNTYSLINQASHTPIYVIHADEALQMARILQKLTFEE